jgi:hypothetical protein
MYPHLKKYFFLKIIDKSYEYLYERPIINYIHKMIYLTLLEIFIIMTVKYFEVKYFDYVYSIYYYLSFIKTTSIIMKIMENKKEIIWFQILVGISIFSKNIYVTVIVGLLIIFYAHTKIQNVIPTIKNTSIIIFSNMNLKIRITFALYILVYIVSLFVI